MPATTDPSAVEFKGKPDPQYVGVYKTTNGRSAYDLKDDGSFALKGKVQTQAGLMDQDVKGSWAVDGDRMLFKYADSVVPYKFKMDGKKLTLSLTGKMKHDTVLIKQ